MGKLDGRLIVWFVSCALMLCFLSVTDLHAQNDDHQDDHRVRYSITAGPAGKRLSELARKAEVTILFDYELIGSTKVNPVLGEYTLMQALEQMLKDTPLSGDITRGGIVRISHNNGAGERTLAMKKTLSKKNEQIHGSRRKAGLFTSASLATMTVISAGQVAAQDDTIVIKGIRGSIEKGLDAKAAADSIVDGAFAEELGKFPDTNVAESLQRITGVAITRSRGGEGRFVTVRGLGEEFNAVTYNGRVLATENAGREFSFDVIASELIAAAEVYKATSASQGDGSIGGLVNIRSALPLDNKGFHGAGKLATQYEELADTFGTRASGVISNTFADDTMGFLASISYQQRDSRTDVAESIGILSVPDLNGNGIQERVNSFHVSTGEQQRERLGGTLAFQYQPNEDTELVVDALYTRFESPSQFSGYSFFPSASGVVSGSETVSADDVVTSHTTNGNAEFLSRFNEADTDTLALGANFKQRFSDKLSATFDLAWSKAEGQRDNTGAGNGSGKFYVLQVFEGQFVQSGVSGAVPNSVFTAGDGSGGQIPFDQIAASQIDLSFSRNTFLETTDEVFSAKADFEYEVGDTASIKFGLDYVEREKSNQLFDNSASWCGNSATVFFCAPGQILSDNIADPANAFTLFNDNFLDGGGGNITRVFPVFSTAVVEEALATLATANGASDFLAVAPNLSGSNVVDESVLGGYVQVDFEGNFGQVPFKANAGVRVAQTDLTSTGFGAEILSAVFEDSTPGVDPIQTFNVNATAPIVANNDYVDVLPAFNITFDLSDTTKLRGSFTQTLTRPTLTDLATFFSVSANFGSEQITQTNPFLEPVRSDNLDISYEYYGDNGISYSIAGFYKDITDFITNQNTTRDITVTNVTDTSGTPIAPITRTFLVSGPQNGDSAEVYGLELAAQFILDSGFGVSGNVTLADSTATSGGQSSALENISDLSANASIFYEANNIQARASLNHRSDYLENTDGTKGLPQIVDDYSQVDLSVGYNLGSALGGENDIFIFAEGANVFDEPFYRYNETKNLLDTYEINGARWTFGVRGSF